MVWLTESFLPTGTVTAVLLDARADEAIKRALSDLGIQLYFSKMVPTLAEPIATHPDMSIFPLGSGEFLCSPESASYYKTLLTPLGAKVFCGNRRLSSTYPSDAAYNIARLGRFAFHRPDMTDETAKEYFIKHKITLLPVSQGYTKCNTCMITDRALITSDDGIAKVARDAGLQVLQIRADHILLKGYSYGFFGGATGMIAPDTLVVTGNLSMHPDAKVIRKFCAKNGVNVISLTDEPLVDIGSILPLIQSA